MADTLVRSLGSLIEERKALQRKEQHLAERQLQLIKGLDQLLHSIGYQLTPVGNNRGRGTFTRWCHQDSGSQAPQVPTV